MANNHFNRIMTYPHIVHVSQHKMTDFSDFYLLHVIYPQIYCQASWQENNRGSNGQIFSSSYFFSGSLYYHSKLFFMLNTILIKIRLPNFMSLYSKISSFFLFFCYCFIFELIPFLRLQSFTCCVTGQCFSFCCSRTPCSTVHFYSLTFTLKMLNFMYVVCCNNILSVFSSLNFPLQLLYFPLIPHFG